MKIGKWGIVLLAVIALVFGFKLLEGGKGEDEAKSALYYKERTEALESELAALRRDQYAVLATYREQMEELEAELAKSKGEYLYVVEDGEVTLTGYSGKEKNVTLPSAIDGLPVTAIGKEAFKNTAVESVILPSSIRKIDWFAFYGCRNLGSIAIPKSVEKIEYGCFDGCSSLSVYCEKGSFAEQYAKSYGLRVVSE